MTKATTVPHALDKLREQFPENQISKLPKPTKKQTDDVRADYKKGIRCAICGSWHHPDVIHLDYVGHAAATDRLLDTDIEWTWEPLAVDQRGLPAFDEGGGLWIKLIVCGVTRLGYGSADGKSGGDAKKEIIGDAIRNAGMRFGMALDLWHKGDLHIDSSDAGDDNVAKGDGSGIAPRTKLDGPYTSKTALWNATKLFDREVRACGDIDSLEAFLAMKESHALLGQLERDAPQLLHGGEGLPDEYEPILALLARTRTDMNRPTYLDAD